MINFSFLWMRMHKVIIYTILLGIFLPVSAIAQMTVLTGQIKNDENQSVAGVEIIEAGTDNRVFSDQTGTYLLPIKSKGKVLIRATLLGYEWENFSIKTTSGDTVRHDITMHRLTHAIAEVQIKDDRLRQEAGTIDINTAQMDELPSTVRGVEGLLKILVGSNNELTSQYTVRGGNFDENLVYVNDFEIYRPFLVRSGQQEGLSFINGDLVQGVSFSVGGFQARYGDKMSSVLDVTYKRPKKFGGSVMLSLLGLHAHLEGASRNKNLTYLLGFRQKSNQYLLQSQPTKGQYNPSFSDFQGLLHYRFNDHWDAELIGNYARNRFRFQPEEQVAAFGYVNEVYRLHTFFEGQENDQFDTYFGGASIRFRPNDRLQLKLLASGFQTNEFETYDIAGEYGLFEVETDLGKTTFGQDKFALGSGMIHDFARNYLTANVLRVAHLGSYNAGNHFFLWGIEGTRVSVDDRLLEWQRRDSAGFSLPFDTSALLMNEHFHATNKLAYSKAAAYLQDNILLSRSLDMTLNLGLRITYSFLNQETILSPRMQYSFKPNWQRDIVFRLAAGLYAQPPFYREMRDAEGILHTDQKAQKSLHFAGGLDYNFKMWGDRPFKLTTELYYKSLWDLVPYVYDDVRIRYFAGHHARGYAYGGEIRLFGDLVKDAESWVSVGYLKTQYQIFNEQTGQYNPFVARPTDQRLNFGMFFSDYLPRNKNFKVYLNLMYATGLPVSVPGKALDPDYRQLRIPDYKRVDIGFAALLLDGDKPRKHAYNLFNAFDDIWLSAEVFNLLGIENTLSYQWIQDFTTERTYAVPNRLTNRLINLKLSMKF